MAGTQSIGEAVDNPVAINVTAMVDVIFCLCIFFMCSFHFKQLQGKLDTWLPGGRGGFAGPGEILRDEIRVVLGVSADGKTVIRRVRNFPAAADDAELMTTVLQLAADYRKAGNTSYPLVIEVTTEVPWNEVVHVMDLCKRNGLERIELSAPERAMAK